MRWFVKNRIKNIKEIDWSSLTEIEQAWLFRSMIDSGKSLQKEQGVSGDILYSLTTYGYCHCCKQQVKFHSDDVWLRDHFSCSSCNSTPRQRNLVKTLDELVPAWGEKIMHESSPSNEYFSHLVDYSFSQYVPDNELGSPVSGGGTNQNIELTTFDSNSFDVFISQDVLEHVFNPEAACKEVLRVLRPGGWHIFTTPRHNNLRKSIQRASLKGSQVKHIKSPEYHENPVGDGKSLVTFDWGRDFEKLLQKWTGRNVLTLDKPDPARGIAGSMFEVFAIQK
ncbi:class I SAM-dependent methyltransferase [Pantoea ananatis]|uniref:class I SAM-dependent methyltransferase n=1 Tax=Pantoea ananas TaxID=553 RepID=UPI0003485EDA|nr:class I SAM-dependent methyltransferase [Pantoea ananatis]PQL04018.1 hypothetical protein CG434_07555 [Pantoea ananatis]